MKHFLLLTMAALAISLGCSAKSHKKGNYHYCSCHGSNASVHKPAEPVQFLTDTYGAGVLTFSEDAELSRFRSLKVDSSINNPTNKNLDLRSQGGALSFAKGAFMDFQYIENVCLPGSLLYIYKETFKNCVSLKSVNVPKRVNGIGKEAFFNCYNLKTIIIPSSVTKIGARAFYRCNNLNVVVMNNEGDVKVGKDAFTGCKSVTYVGKDKPLAYNEK